MKKSIAEPDLVVTKESNRNEHVVDLIGDMKPGQTAQVEVSYDTYSGNLMNSIRNAYPRTMFTHQDFKFGGKRYVYIYIEGPKRSFS